MELTEIPIEQLIPYARNARTHSEDQVAQIAASIKEFGFTNPVLIDDDGGIIAGHGRVLAARKLNLLSVPVIKLDYLTKNQKRAYIIADNKLALAAGWDEELLKLELEELNVREFDILLTGFNEEMLFSGESIAANNEGECDFKPKLSPEISSAMVTQQQVSKKEDELGGQFQHTGNKLINVVCPNCGEDFNVSG